MTAGLKTTGRDVILAAALIASCAVQAAAQSAPAQTPAPTMRRDPRTQPQGFSIVLVLADLQATSAQDDVPPAARRALTDMKDFLPYKSYKLLDAAWILGQGTSTTRLKGADEQEYELRLASSINNEAGVFVRFVLDNVDDDGESTRSPLHPAVRRDPAAREQEIAKLQTELEEAQRQKRQKEIEQLQAALAELRASRQPGRVSGKGRPVMDTSFSMQVGETVVVGTSRLRGGSRALIALLTSVPPRSSTPVPR